MRLWFTKPKPKPITATIVKVDRRKRASPTDDKHLALAIHNAVDPAPYLPTPAEKQVNG